MLSVQQQQQQQQEEEYLLVKDQDFYFLGQHLNSPELLLEEEEYPTEYHGSAVNNNFDIANRAFYATINKFTRQSCPDAASRRRSAPYSFLENWHLHSIYSKSQQTLLGITPVRPSVLLSGDDFMFTPPFIQQEEEDGECEQQEEIWSSTEAEYYNLSPCPDSNGATGVFLYSQQEDGPTFETSIDKSFYNHHTQENIWIENESRNNFEDLSIHIQQNDDLLILQPQQQEEEEEDYTTDSSSDEQRCSITSDEEEGEEELSSYDLVNLYDEEQRQPPISPVTRSSSFLSQKSSSSVMSYQSLADIINKSNNHFEDRNHYGSIHNDTPCVDNTLSTFANRDIESGVQPEERSIWSRILAYLMNIYNFFFFVIFSSPITTTTTTCETQPLL
ncbi:uncharacterized protein EV154DRAFT_533461 [Mucor mucedo]|uniref:uncharacterized protein n=1 Tax=Mucor mucedo TaxID=29922 RepID=UPI0022211C4B|nr:uncharacterized protein EV154DRAFT_533461 [Mucor mucedo]KAI7865303.1 hypothetical protein EV154DRAFT_533461 [Mucor mucedo]